MTLRNQDADVYSAVMWLRENRQMFQKHVFEPVCLELNIKDITYVNAIENALRGQLKVKSQQIQAIPAQK